LPLSPLPDHSEQKETRFKNTYVHRLETNFYFKSLYQDPVTLDGVILLRDLYKFKGHKIGLAEVKIKSFQIKVFICSAVLLRFSEFCLINQSNVTS